MGLLKKQTLQDIGKGIEYTGYGLLGIASIVLRDPLKFSNQKNTITY